MPSAHTLLPTTRTRHAPRHRRPSASRRLARHYPLTLAYLLVCSAAIIAIVVVTLAHGG